MGHIQSQASHRKIMPELLVFQDNHVLMVKGVEENRVFWWPPGAYWIDEKICDLEREEPKEWIRRVLHDQVNVTLKQAFLKSINIVASNHAPVFVYKVNVEGTPKPNVNRGFSETSFFDPENLPTKLGRDDKHGLWLHTLLTEHMN